MVTRSSFARAANIPGHATSSASVSPFLVIRIGRTYPHLRKPAAILGFLQMCPFSFFLLVIATFPLSRAALLLDSMLTERKPKRSPSVATATNTPSRLETSGRH